MKPNPKGVTGAVMDPPEASTERKHVYVETYGCQMNVNDSEVMLSVLETAGYDATDDMHDADVILVNTCAIREKAEAKIWQRLAYFKSLRRRKKKTEKPVVGVLGCMAERLKTRLLEADQLADLVAGPGRLPRPPQPHRRRQRRREGDERAAERGGDVRGHRSPVRKEGRTRLSSPSCAAATTRVRFASSRTPAAASEAGIRRPSSTRCGYSPNRASRK